MSAEKHNALPIYTEPKAHPAAPEPLDLAAIRAKLAGAKGQQYWRSLEELAETPGFQEFLHREFPENASEWNDPAGRRNFLKLMAASLAFAGLSGCSVQQAEKIVPYVRAPEELIPGKPLFFATAMPLSGIATGLLVESHEGRPTKIEGNPEHPASLGATDVFAQASILTMYDPDRSQVVLNGGRISTWGAFISALRTQIEEVRISRGAGLRFLTETVTSPTLAAQIQAVLAEFPAAKWHQYEPAGRHSARAGAKMAFSEYAETRYHLDKADVIFSLDADFLCAGPGHVRYTREFSARRRIRGGEHAHHMAAMNRLYVAESTPSNTGTMADHRLPVRARDVEHFARAVAQKLGVNTPGPAAIDALKKPAHAKWVDALTGDLKKHRGSSVVIAGEQQPPVVHALAHAINAALGNVGSTVTYTASVETNPTDQMESLRELVRDMHAGNVELLMILGGNPVYNAPADFHFAEALRKVPLRAHLNLYDDETSTLCQWHLPETHYLEAWSDARAFDGTITILQPLIAPLYEGRSAHELLAAFTKNPAKPGYEILRESWQKRMPAATFEKTWRHALHDGLVEGSALPEKKVALKTPIAGPAEASNPDARGLEVVFRPDPCIYDGQFANNGWLQELPKPLTKMVWDNAALMSPATAQELKLPVRPSGNMAAEVERVQLTFEGRSVEAPVWVLPGHADGSITLHLGYGRTRTGHVGQGAGFNAYALRASSAPMFSAGLRLERTGGIYPISLTQHHHSMEAPQGRVDLIVREATLEEFRKNPEFVKEIAEKEHSEDPAPSQTLYPPEHEYKGNAWGLSVDIGACTGCNACVVACQSENNIPVVGKIEVARGREMHWIRIDRYYKGALENPHTVNQPVMCMHCENAPCEVVCPVAATVHSEEGLNDMVYNRCVGTRYCSNNCPYKVRRFNFFEYSDYETASLKLMRNPNVTVRTRGVMEKCSYCVQRINAARINAEADPSGPRPIRDGEIVTACQQACPAEAITFGNINDKDSRVASLKAEPLNYGLLTDLNTRPRTTYLARVRNPNPEIEGE